MAISCLQLPCFPVKYPRSTTLRSTLWYFDFVLRRWFVQSLETLPWEITKIFYWRANILNQSERSVCWRTDRLKKAPCPCRRFFKLLPPQSSHGFSALARLYYLARPNKTAMLRRLPSLLAYMLIDQNLTCENHVETIVHYSVCCLLWPPNTFWQLQRAMG